ncbi:efflux RND transporter periplasmic adaptor subunit [Rubellicoccus peritrichatus]|uniref:Efflux RND transporter periplasmic adaptor subunit n=1 Tax=Rubellicoccus peritrichatus TaxID=3080537 RepID=A0AAQ3LCB7_9BACT|nr:efflux RND transporter periplasmic adaptor subunit [Puniceicoccus sp. CR14]WOO41889.1 efflux RND transporter periplasmic adaptor subunit [Puniceicoccus sp. CR14]
MLKKAIIAIIVIGILVGGGLALRQASNESKQGKNEVTVTAKAERQTIEEAIDESGFVEPVISTDVRSEISGKIARILVEQGDEVAQGTPLMELDRVTLENDLIQAQRNNQSDLLRLEQAKRDYERLRDLHEKKFAQEKEFLDAETNYKLAEIQIEVSEARLKNAKENLDKTVIRAPQAGVISDLNVNEGQVIIGATSVNEGTKLMVIHDLSSLYVRLEINELDIAKIEEGMPAEVTFDSVPDLKFDGVVSEIHPFAFNQSNLRVFRIEVTFDTKGVMVRPGISADIRIVTDRVEDAVTVSLSAVFADEDERYVYVVEEAKEEGVKKRPVEIGISDTKWVEIREGLTEGETVSLVRPTGNSLKSKAG